MCGIFGARRSWLAASRGEPDAVAAAALAALRWRGPDGAGLVQCGDFVLGCARLSITERRSRQPLVRRGGRFAAVLNGAITDARSRWQERSPRWLRRPTLPNDAWLPLLTCGDGRADELAALCGHHALAVADGEADELWLARDAAGEKPLYVALANGVPVAFASTAGALAALGVRLALPPDAVARFFAYGFCGAPVSATAGIAVESSLAGVHRARGRSGRLERVGEPGERVGLRGNAGARPPCAADDAVGVAVRAAEDTAPRVPTGAVDGIGATLGGTPGATLAATLGAAVARCIDVGPDQPVALSLSGGLDSSCLAAELAAAGAATTAYQFRAAGDGGEERDVAAAVAAHCGLRLARVDGGPEVLDALPRLTALHGLPLGDPSVLAVHALACAAAADGVRVLLSGEGADELLYGYDRHRALRRLPRTRAPLPWLPRWSMRRSARLLRALAAADPYAELLAVTPPAFRADVLRLDAPRLVAGASESDGATASGAVARGVAAVGPARAGTAAERLRRAAAVDAACYLRWDLLPKLDVATMAAGIEGRCPFLDPAVRAAAAAEPPLQAIGKAALRAAYRARLPARVFAQRKRGFALPLDRWFRSALPWLDLLRDARTRQRAHVRPDGLARAIDRHRSGKADLGHALYLVVAFEVWLRQQEAPCA